MDIINTKLSCSTALVLLVFGHYVVDIGDGFHALELAEFDGVQFQDGIIAHIGNDSHDAVPRGGVYTSYLRIIDAVPDTSLTCIICGKGEFQAFFRIGSMAPGRHGAVASGRGFPHAPLR